MFLTKFDLSLYSDELERVREKIHESIMHQNDAFTSSLCEIEAEKLETEHRLLVRRKYDLSSSLIIIF